MSDDDQEQTEAAAESADQDDEVGTESVPTEAGSDQGNLTESEGDTSHPETVNMSKSATVVPDDSSAVFEVPVEISCVLGSAQIQVSQLLKMGRGAVLELDRTVGDPVDIYVNKRRVAQGEVVVVEDRLGVTLNEALRADQFE